MLLMVPICPNLNKVNVNADFKKPCLTLIKIKHGFYLKRTFKKENNNKTGSICLRKSLVKHTRGLKE